MCLILISHRPEAEVALTVLANRDEFYARPSLPAAPWQECPELIAGRDLASAGTWFGACRDRWATVTNFREGVRNEEVHSSKSRGWLVRDYLCGSAGPEDFLTKIDNTSQFAGFNLLLGNADELWYHSNRTADARLLPPGLYGLSNHLLDTPWPKVIRGKAGLKRLVEQPSFNYEAAFRLLADTALATDNKLPDTGIPLEWERALSAIFVAMPDYGTRCSTILTATSGGHYHLTERRFTGAPESWQESEFFWSL